MAKSARTKRGGKKASRKAAGGGVSGGIAGGLLGGLGGNPDEMILIPPDTTGGETNITIKPDGGVEIETPDGAIHIDSTGQSLREEDDSEPTHTENLAEKIDHMELGRIAEELLTAIEADKQDRTQWENMRAKCIELLGLKLEDPKADVSRSSLGMSTSMVRDPVLLQAVEFFRANAYAELCPSGGPVKVVNFDTVESIQANELASALETDLNYYLTTTASEYYPDMYYMLWWTGLASGTFKKVYMCPLRRRPVSEFVDGTKLIVPSNATDLKNASRVTHEIEMRRSVLRRMQMMGVYRDINLTDPISPVIDPVKAKRAAIEGKAAKPQRPEDEDYTVYECYCELDIKGYEHEEDGEPSGLPLPYRVTIDETSREVLEIRRNWDEDDEDQRAEIPFVLFPFSTGLSRIYGSGLGQMMGNMASALTALMRISIDAGLLGNYPGMVKAKGSGRDVTNEMFIPPGGVIEIDTGGLPIQQMLMPVPYKEASPTNIQLMEQTRGVAKQLGGVADIPVGEGKQDAPVGTTLAMIEQATKPASATHKMLHSAQSEEFRLLVKLFKDDPESLWKGNRRPALGDNREARLAQFKLALDNCNIQPMADPNVPSEMHRKLLALFLKQITAGNPAYNAVEIDKYIAKSVMKMPEADFNKFIAPPQAGQPDPLMVAALEVEKMKAQTGQQKVMVDAAKVQQQAKEAEADRALRAETDAMKLAVGYAGKAGQKPPHDPNKVGEMNLKHRDQALKEATLMVNTRLKEREMGSKEAIEAFKLAQATYVHPEAAGLANAQLQDLNAFIAPAAADNAQDRGVAAGGVVQNPVKPEPAPKQDPEDMSEAQRAVKLALEITNALQDMQRQPYIN